MLRVLSVDWASSEDRRGQSRLFLRVTETNVDQGSRPLVVQTIWMIPLSACFGSKSVQCSLDKLCCVIFRTVPEERCYYYSFLQMRKLSQQGVAWLVQSHAPGVVGSGSGFPGLCFPPQGSSTFQKPTSRPPPGTLRSWGPQHGSMVHFSPAAPQHIPHWGGWRVWQWL